MPNFRLVIPDRDGVLNTEATGGFVTDPKQFQWLFNVLDALAGANRQRQKYRSHAGTRKNPPCQSP